MKLAVLVIVAAGVIMALAAVDPPTAATADEPVILALDADPSGNSATSLGPIDSCAEATPGGSANLDLVVDQIPAGVTGLISYEVHLYFDADNLQVSSLDDTGFLLSANPGSGSLASLSGAIGAVMSDYVVAAIDFEGDQENGGEEHGPGVLARITVSVDPSAPPGVYPVTISTPPSRDLDSEAIVADDSGAIPVTEVFDAFIAVGVPCASFSTASAVGIDVDPSGNSPTNLGAIDSSLDVSCNETFDVDLIIQGVQAIHAFDFSLSYNRNIVWVTGVDVEQMLAENGGSNVLDLSDGLPDSDGFYGARAQDLATDPAAAESGEGVLPRVTLKGVGGGTSDLTVQIEGVSPILSDVDGNPIEPNDNFGVFSGTVLDATVSVDKPCGPPPSATTPTPTPAPQTPSASPDGASGTPSAGTPGGSSVTPTTTVTPSDTPSTGGAPGDDTDGGLSWLAIVGIIAGVVALAGGGGIMAHQAWRRRRQQP